MAKDKNEALEAEINEVMSEKAENTRINKPTPIAQTNKLPVGDAAKPLSAESGQDSFIDNVYQQINSVIGGSNPKQFLCLTLPGQVLAAEDYIYDYKNNAPKGPVIEANESRLVNKLFDPCRMTGSDNGLTLPYQYRTALDMLTPKLNAKVAEAKNELRKLLMTEYPYDFGDNSDKKYTLQEVFFRLYDDWINENKKWSDKQNEQKELLRKKFPATDEKNNVKFNDAYLEWYETFAESNLNAINEKMSKVISVFTPNDMKILEGILDSGSGAELQQARQTLTNSQKLTPDGGYVYPVKLNPTNWFEQLGTSFTPIDLLKTPDVLAIQLQSLSSRRISINSKIAEISAMIPDNKAIEQAHTDVINAQKVLDDAQSTLIKDYGDGIKTILDTVFDIAPLFVGGAVPANIIMKLASGITLSNGKSVSDLITAINDKMSGSFNAQRDLVNAGQKLADASAEAVKTQNLDNLKSVIIPLKEQLDEIDLQISNIQAQIQLATLTQPSPDKDGKVTDTDTSVKSVTPTAVPTGYTQVVISASASTLDNSSQSITNSSVSTSGFSFLFCGYNSNSSSSDSLYKSITSGSDVSILVGMNVAKIGIEREWFNPGVFALTKDMFNVTNLKIAPNPAIPPKTMDDRLKEMAEGDSVFPCFPVAMVIARDISIKFVFKTNSSSDFSQMVEKHASSGGGFLFFSGSGSSSSASSLSGAHVSSTDNTVTIKFDTPQIIGYYLEVTAADKSSYLDDTSGDYKAGYVTISQFVEDYKKMLDAMKKTDSGN